MKKYLLFFILAALAITTASELDSAQEAPSEEQIRNAVERALLYPPQETIVEKGPLAIGNEWVIFAINPIRRKKYSAYFNPSNSQYEVFIEQYNKNKKLVGTKILDGENAKFLFEALIDSSTIDTKKDEAAETSLFGG